MPEREPADQAVRNRIRDDLHETFFVQAGAGTGKTTALVARVVNLVRKGTPVSAIAAITFTELAAAELAGRIREALTKVAGEGDVPAVEKARAGAALDEIDGAPIQTLHAFARRILGAYPIEAGLPPAFDVLDGASADLEFEEKWAAFLDELLGEGGPVEPLSFLYALGARTDALRDVARVLHDNWDRLDQVPAAPYPGPFDERGLTNLLAALAALPAECTDDDDRLVARIRGITADSGTALASESPVSRLRFWSREWKGGGLGRRSSWRRPVAEVREEVARLDGERRAILTGHAEACLAVVVDRIAGFVRTCVEERRAAGRLHYHDLLVRARDLLRSSEVARAGLHGRFPTILIDEFQDTDPLQVEIASLIARDPAASASNPWDAVPVPRGTLFVVGDPKQSIYRFRRADVELYARARGALGGTALSLVQNFRSQPPVIDWINRVFPALMPPSGDPARAVHENLVSRFGEPLPDAGVHYVGDRVADAGADAVRRAEAEEIARVVADLCARGVRVRDDDDRGTRPLRRSDIAVLFRTRASVAPLELAFDEAQIPYRVESQSTIYNSAESRDIASILRTLVDPTDEVALVAALRSPAFACSDRDLFAFHASGGRWNYLDPGAAPAGTVSDALAWLRDHHEAALARPASVTLDQILSERQMFVSALALPRPRQRWQRYRYLLEQARAFSTGPTGDARYFVAWLDAQRKMKARAVETVMPESDDDACRLLTIHAAKGLEFPVVILAGLGSKDSTSAPRLLFAHGTFEAALGGQESPIRTSGFDAALAREGELDEFERARLLYVAATRARDVLVVSLFRTAGQKSPLLEGVIEACDGANGEIWSPYRYAAPAPAAPRETAVPPAATMADLEAWREDRAAKVARYASGNAIAATALAHLAPGFEPPDARSPGEEERPWRRGRAGTSVGRAVHAVLQVVDLVSGDGAESAARVQALAEGIPDREAEVAALARAAFGARCVREAVASGRFWREVFVSAPVEARLLEGFIDLLYDRGDGLVVVDYKTDVLSGEAAVDAAVERYRLQIAAYALALEVNLGRPVVDCRLLFLSARGPVERALPGLAGAREDVQVLLRAEAAVSGRP